MTISLSSKEKYLFLHYGPGGNASIERVLLKSLCNIVDFWDQPTDCSSYQHLCNVVNKKWESSSAESIVAHSFGCTLIHSIMRITNKVPKSIVLLSPVRDYPKAYLNFANLLNKKENTEVLLSGILPAAEEDLSKQDSNIAEICWRAIQSIVSIDNWFQYNWAKETSYLKVLSIADDTVPLDFINFKNIFLDYVIQEDQLYPMDSSIKKVGVLPQLRCSSDGGECRALGG